MGRCGAVSVLQGVVILSGAHILSTLTVRRNTNIDGLPEGEYRSTANIDDGLEEKLGSGGDLDISEVIKHRVKRYALEGSRWRVNEITYRISKYSDQLPKKTVDNIIRKAFNTWSEVTNLKFVEKKTGKVHIDIRFEKKDHGDDAPFDGPGGYRAHAFFPGYGGDAHFDDDEKWTLGQTATRNGSRLLLVATHELGHSLGLGHSEDRNALMASSHEEWKGKVKLSADDIKAIQALYGKPGEPRPESGDPSLGRGPGPNGPRGPGVPIGPGGPPFVPGGGGIPPFHPSHGFPGEHGPPFHGGPPPHIAPPPPPVHPADVPRGQPIKPSRQPRPNKNNDDASTDFDVGNDDDDFEFLDDEDDAIGNSVDEFNDDIDGKRPPISQRNKELCNGGGVDTMITLKNDDSYVFKGKKYWKLTATSIAKGYPRIISDDWYGLPGNLDAAFTWKNGKMYFFKGTRYWRFSASKELDPGFPKDISEGFEGIPNDVDAAFVWGKNDKIYFFKGSDYWKFDPKKNPPVDESYPRPISNWDGIPNHLNAAMQYHNGNTYFFKDGQYYRFDENTFAVDKNGPSYPRDTGAWWFGCGRDDSPRRLKKKNNSRRFILD